MSFRIEEKLLVDPHRLNDLYSWVGSCGGETLHPPRRIYSTYLDNDLLTMFSDSEEGVVPRRKIRLRSYDTTRHTGSRCALEIKTSSVEGRYKTSQDLSGNEVENLLRSGMLDPQYGNCVPTVSVDYSREYFTVAGVRLTIDRQIRYRAHASPFWTEDPAIAVEVKAPPTSSFDFLDRSFPFRRIRFSKYVRAVRVVRNMSEAWV